VDGAGASHVGQGETINVPDVGERLILRVGSSPLPQDGRLCAFVENPVVWGPLTDDAVHQRPRLA
jgi:hypothetical protein